MLSSSTERRAGADAWWRRAPEGRGTWLRLGVLLLVALALVVAPTPGRTGALMTDVTVVGGTVMMLPTPTPTEPTDEVDDDAGDDGSTDPVPPGT